MQSHCNPILPVPSLPPFLTVVIVVIIAVVGKAVEAFVVLFVVLALLVVFFFVVEDDDLAVLEDGVVAPEVSISSWKIPSPERIHPLDSTSSSKSITSTLDVFDGFTMIKGGT